MTAVRLGGTDLPVHQSARRALFVTLFGAAFLTWILFRNTFTLPHNDDEPLFRSLNSIKDAVDENRTALEPIRTVITGIVSFFDDMIASLGWPGVIGVAARSGWCSAACA